VGLRYFSNVYGPGAWTNSAYKRETCYSLVWRPMRRAGHTAADPRRTGPPTMGFSLRGREVCPRAEPPAIGEGGFRDDDVYTSPRRRGNLAAGVCGTIIRRWERRPPTKISPDFRPAREGTEGQNPVPHAAWPNLWRALRRILLFTAEHPPLSFGGASADWAYLAPRVQQPMAGRRRGRVEASTVLLRDERTEPIMSKFPKPRPRGEGRRPPGRHARGHSCRVGSPRGPSGGCGFEREFAQAVALPTPVAVGVELHERLAPGAALPWAPSAGATRSLRVSHQFHFGGDRTKVTATCGRTGRSRSTVDPYTLTSIPRGRGGAD